MERIKNNYHYIISSLVLGGIVFSVMYFNGPPLFENLDNFVLFAQEEVNLEQGVQVSSGDIGANKRIDIEKDVIVNRNLFADEITLDKNAAINGNISFNKLKTHKETKILGTQTKPISFPIANLPEVLDFQIGTQDFKFEGQDNILLAWNYRDFILEKNSRLTLTGGIYNLHKLELKENSTLIFDAPTTINIQFKLKGQNNVFVLPANNIKPTDIAINYLGIKPKKETKIEEDDEAEINGLLDEKERKDFTDGKIGRPVVFGKNSFLNFKLLAPKTDVHIGEAAILRGQILARKIKIEKGGILSKEEVFSKDTDPNKIITVEREKFPVNEILVVLRDDATFLDAQNIASLVKGRINGFIDTPQVYKIEVPTNTPTELDNLIAFIEAQNNPLVLFVLRNSLGGLR